MGAALALGCIALLLVTAAALTLPDVSDSASYIAALYSGHRALVIILHIRGVVPAALLGGYACGCEWSTG